MLLLLTWILRVDTSDRHVAYIVPSSVYAEHYTQKIRISLSVRDTVVITGGHYQYLTSLGPS